MVNDCINGACQRVGQTKGDLPVRDLFHQICLLIKHLWKFGWRTHTSERGNTCQHRGGFNVYDSELFIVPAFVLRRVELLYNTLFFICRCIDSQAVRKFYWPTYISGKMLFVRRTSYVIQVDFTEVSKTHIESVDINVNGRLLLLKYVQPPLLSILITLY